MTRRTCSRRHSSTSCPSGAARTSERPGRDECAARRLAGQHDLPLLVGPADVLPRQRDGVQRPGQFRAACIPAIVNPDAGVRAGQGQLRSQAGPALEHGRLRAAERVQLLLRPGQPDRGESSAASPIATRTSRSSRTRGCPANTNVQFRFEVFNIWNWHIFSAPWSISAAYRRSTPTWPARLRQVELDSVTDPRSIQLAARFEFYERRLSAPVRAGGHARTAGPLVRARRFVFGPRRSRFSSAPRLWSSDQDWVLRGVACEE